MIKPTRSNLLDALTQWGAYPDAFKRLPPDRQAAFLHEQGFPALQDLLGHVIGWWEEGRRLVQGLRTDPAFVYLEPDTDAFNAELVKASRAQTEAEMLTHFEEARLGMIDLVAQLPDTMLAQPLVREWLLADVIEHLEEHRLPG